MSEPEPVLMWAVYTTDSWALYGKSDRDISPRYVFEDESEANLCWKTAVATLRRCCPSYQNPEAAYTVRRVTITPDESEKNDE